MAKNQVVKGKDAKRDAAECRRMRVLKAAARMWELHYAVRMAEGRA